jgi:predicted secreted hydrolase
VWSFPEDHWAHRDYRLEWWYFTGHLETTDTQSRRFGYQLTIFRIGLHAERLELDSDWAAANLLMGHAAITDKETGRHVFSEVLYREAEFLAGFGAYPDPEIAWSRAPAGTDARWSLRWNGEAFDFAARDEERGIAFDLTTRPLKPLLFQGPNGFSRKAEAPGAASLYYSFTRLATNGTIDIGGATHEVRGESWMDKEFSTSHLGEEQVGWDWFSLQLDDGRELMLYAMRGEAGSADFSRGTLVSPEGEARYLADGEWQVRATTTWNSPETGADYPAGWEVTVPSAGLDIRVRPEVDDQENVGRLAGGLHSWEGAAGLFDADGARVGSGYVELTGYGEGNRPPV